MLIQRLMVFVMLYIMLFLKLFAQNNQDVIVVSSLSIYSCLAILTESKSVETSAKLASTFGSSARVRFTICKWRHYWNASKTTITQQSRSKCQTCCISTRIFPSIPHTQTRQYANTGRRRHMLILAIQSSRSRHQKDQRCYRRLRQVSC